MDPSKLTIRHFASSSYAQTSSAWFALTRWCACSTLIRSMSAMYSPWCVTVLPPAWREFRGFVAFRIGLDAAGLHRDGEIEQARLFLELVERRAGNAGRNEMDRMFGRLAHPRRVREDD